MDEPVRVSPEKARKALAVALEREIIVEVSPGEYRLGDIRDVKRADEARKVREAVTRGEPPRAWVPTPEEMATCHAEEHGYLRGASFASGIMAERTRSAALHAAAEAAISLLHDLDWLDEDSAEKAAKICADLEDALGAQLPSPSERVMEKP